MGALLRFFLACAALPACWGLLRALAACFVAVSDGGELRVETLALLGGMALFAVWWFVSPHPVRTYVLGHELTHALWGLAFGGRASGLKVGSRGGSVRITKSNVLIILAPYFFPFYTFLVLLAAFGTWVFVRPLPLVPLWTFLLGFTWAFHVLFTLETLAQKQPDVQEYGRLFSWVLIFAVNLLIVMVFLACTTALDFANLGRILSDCLTRPYFALGGFLRGVLS